MTDWILFLNITLFVIIGEFSSDLLVMALRFFCKKSQVEIDIEKEIREIKAKMEKMSMIDEFAKYAKLQRRLNTLKTELKAESNDNREMFNSMKYLISFVVDFFWNVISFVFIWSNLNTPLLHLNPSWLVPVNGFIGWPSATAGDLGVLSWYLVVKNVTKKLRTQI